MKTAFAAALGAAGCLLAPSAFAQTYVSGGYSVLQVDTHIEDVTLGAITARVGYEFNPFLAVEGEVSVGVDDDEYRDGGSTFTTSLEHQVGAFAVGRLPVPGIGTLFARAGYATTSIDDPGNRADDGRGLAFGAGIEFDLIPGITTRLEYTAFDDNLQSFGVSGQRKF